ncbi:hypothetical protein [Saccharopolyspora cebuensis]|uniref:Zinc-finger n=1 Tax=Saccharopolyspora cebuensis TaxID=418759 RepID=A0ABV4CNI0_9PSEU
MENATDTGGRKRETVRGTEHAAIQRRLAPYSTGEVDGVEWVLLHTHVAGCAACRAEVEHPAPRTRAAPRRIPPRPRPRPRPAPPRWPVVCGGLAVAALVVTSVTHAACSW